MKYEISYTNPLQHFIDICLQIDQIEEDTLYLQCPSWRPGRYELANFAKNIQKIYIEGENGEKLLHKKLSKDCWEVKTGGHKSIKVHYNYYAQQMDAGGSWLDEEQLYINFVNCMLYEKSRLEEEIEVKLQLPEDYEIACGLEKIGPHHLKAPNFYRLADSPMIASNQLLHNSFEAAGHTFHLWFMGDVSPNWEKLFKDFKAYTLEQISTMGDFPCKEYHYLFQILPYQHYHGVEHFNSTVITLGPSEDFHSDKLYDNLLGVSSHELFHTWNVIRIRPAEMMPYDFSQENYHQTGFVTEGVTTYYGDLFLARSGVYSLSQYFGKLNGMLKRHIENPGRFNLSVAESSFDTWLDGYVQGIPNRKVSIYIKGALAALILDLELRKMSDGEMSLDDVMRYMWEEYGKKEKGYRFEDYRKAAEAIAGVSLQNYFDEIISGKEAVETKLQELLGSIGCELEKSTAEADPERMFGFRVEENEQLCKVQAIIPGSLAEKSLSVNDELVAVDGIKVNSNFNKLAAGKQELTLSLFRNHKLREIHLKNSGEVYFEQLQVVPSEKPSAEQCTNFRQWLKQKHPAEGAS